MIRSRWKNALGAVIVALALTVPATWGVPAPSGATERQPPTAAGTPARFEGGTLDLSESWGEATSCVVWLAGEADCFRTRAGSEAFEARQGLARRAAPPDATRPGLSSRPEPRALLIDCADDLDLYSDINWGGTHLALRERLVWHNLSAYSFDNVLSSFTVGSCSSQFAENPSGGGAQYGAGANVSLANIGATWNDRVSSIYIQ